MWVMGVVLCGCRCGWGSCVGVGDGCGAVWV